MNPPIITPELNTALITLLMVFIGYVTALLKKKLDVLQRDTKPNHGSTTRDAVNRIEQSVEAIAGSVATLKTEHRETQKDIGGMREELRTLARADETVREQKAADHKQLWQAINQISEGK